MNTASRTEVAIHGCELPEEIQALLALAPSSIKITRIYMDLWKLEYAWSQGATDGTSTRWMSVRDHSLEDWAEALSHISRERPP